MKKNMTGWLIKWLGASNCFFAFLCGATNLEASLSDITTILSLAPFYQATRCKIDIDFDGLGGYEDYIHISGKEYFGAEGKLHIISPPLVIEVAGRVGKGCSGRIDYQAGAITGMNQERFLSAGGKLMQGSLRFKLSYLNFFEQKLSIYPLVGVQVQRYDYGTMGEATISHTTVSPQAGLEANILFNDQTALYAGLIYSYSMGRVKGGGDSTSPYLFSNIQGQKSLPTKQNGVALSASLIRDIAKGWSWVASCELAVASGKRKGPDFDGFDIRPATLGDGTYPSKKYSQAPIIVKSQNMQLAMGLAFGF